MWRLLALIGISIGLGAAVAYAQIINPSGGGGGTPGGSNTQLQFNTNSTFGGISGVTSDSANVGFATNSQLLLYGFTVGDCVKIGTGNALADFGAGCGGSGSPGGASTQIQFNSAGSFAGVSGATSIGSNISFTTNSLVINGQAISGIAGATGTLASVTGTLVSGNCVQSDASHNLIDSGSATCGGITSSSTNIAAGSNITTSGSTANVTVNVVATPSFTTVIASGNITAGTAQFTGAATGTTAQFQTYTGTQINLSGTASITASTIQLSGLLTASTGNFAGLTVQGLTGCVQAGGNGQFTTTGVNCATQTSTPSIAAGSNITTSGTAANTTINVVATPSFTTVIASGNITAGTAQFTGQLTGTSAVFQTVTVNNLTPTGPNCLQETGGVLQATNAACATPTSVSIAQGNNIVTSGTATNITVTATPTGASSSVQFNNAGVFGGDVGFQYAGGTTGIVTYTLGPGNLTTTNSKALSIIGTLSSGTVQFNPPLFMNITTNAFASGTKIVDIQGSGISYLSVFASTGVNILGNLTSTQAQITGWLTAPGVNMQTATLAGALIGTSGNFSTNLTANIAQFAGFMSAGGASLSGLTIATETLSSNLTGTTANFSSNLTANIAQFAGFLSAGGASLSGLTIQTETLSSNLTGTTANFSSNLTGQIAAFPGFLTASGASFNSLTVVNSLTSSTGNFTSILSASIYTGTATGAGTLSFITPGIAQFATGGTAATNNGWMNWGGESRLAADKGLNISNAGLTPTGLSVNVQGGRNYSIDADLYVTLAVAATSGIAVSLSGTYGSTDTHYFGYVVDGGSNTSAAGTSNPIRGATLATAKNTIVGNVSLSGTTGYVSVKGTVSVSAPGTLLIAAATVNTQTAANGVSLTRGSRILVQDMP